jgi:hypothetical protein
LDLPVRIVRDTGDEPVIACDGAWGARGLALSHWPGHDTPAELRHELSTGAALRFAALSRAERLRLAAGAQTIANNHYDTDGTLSLFAVRFPDEALPRRARMLEAAACGDFYRVPTEAAFVVDAIVTELPRSELLGALAGTDARELDDLGRWQLATDHLLERLPAILDGDVAPYRELWEEPLEALRADRAALSVAERRDHAGADLTVWASPAGAPCPSRHALFGETPRDRALWLSPGPEGTRARLVISTRSWFDLPGVERPPRPDPVALARALDEREGEPRWHAQPADNPSPELWCGAAGLASFEERNGLLEPSRLPAAELEAAIVRALGSESAD